MFGAQAKPAFSFGGTSTAPAPGFGGGFGTTTTGGGLFNQPKPGGLFGGTATNTFGGGASAFGTGGGFGAGSSAFGTGGGLNLGGQAMAPAQAQAAGGSTIQQQLLSLAASPYGENPLFKSMLSDSNRRQEILKPTNPAAQKALAANTYKVSPHRNVKIRMKPKDDNDKTAIFEGLDDGIMSAGEVFIPRSSVKKLVLRSRPSDTSSLSVSAVPALDSEEAGENSLTVGLNSPRPDKRVEEQETANDTTTNVDDSFAALNTRKKSPAEDIVGSEIQEEVGEGEEGGGGVVVLTRAGYYTIPPARDLVLDQEGRCLVAGFTIGRDGYGNIHYPGNVNVAGINLDENVFIRHKEVIVYPDDTAKPPLGEGLNRKAQITLDKVWPLDKSSGDTIRSPARLRTMSYEEKLERASARLGARFIEYRPETGSWVFKVEHFSKYGLDDSDSEDNVLPDNTKKFKTLEKRPEMKSLANVSTGQVLDNSAKSIVLSTNDNAANKDRNETDGDFEEEEEERDVEMDAEPAVRTSIVRSALFSDEVDTAGAGQSLTKPVILQHRVASLTIQPRVIENIANSVLGHVTSRGLGGHSLTNSFSVNMSGTFLDHSSSFQRESVGRGPARASRPLASYSLQGGYDRFVPLATSDGSEAGAVVVPRYQHAELPLERSLLAERWGRLADCGLARSKAARPGWGRAWHIVSVGPGLGAAGACLGDISVSSLHNVTCGRPDSLQLESLEQWFGVCLASSSCHMDPVGGPLYSPELSLDTLHSHAGEAARQRAELAEASLDWAGWVEAVDSSWQLVVALWGRLEEAGVTGEETVETHGVTVARREALSAWLEQRVGPAARKDGEQAELARCPPRGVLAQLSAGQVGRLALGLAALVSPLTNLQEGFLCFI